MSSKKKASLCSWQETAVNNSSRTPVYSNSEMMSPQRIKICINTAAAPKSPLRILRSVDESQWTRIWLGREVNKTGRECNTVSKMSQASYNNIQHDKLGLYNVSTLP
jgi:hypothetical protein